ncbi:uncharacterized protein [Parasteatoda tepidariorum]|uniref:uncharacterized protein n=1 Tax=Parasteatoda tepidariorum TaxID=114398 RepID=UPI0039BC8ADA
MPFVLVFARFRLGVQAFSPGTNAGAGVSCSLFSFYTPIGSSRTAFDAEVSAISVALSQLQNHLEKFNNVVILSDSKAALQAIASSKAPASADILHCRQALHRLDQHNKNVAMQWVPAHCGLQGNETADFLAKKAAKILQISLKPVPFHTAKRLIKISLRTTFEAKLQEANKNKDWLEGIKDIPSWPREKSVALFRLATGHDCLSKHLYKIKIFSSPLCPLCNQQEEMDANHLRHCPALPPGPLWERYWRARCIITDL